jgi:hypothetical protein
MRNLRSRNRKDSLLEGAWNNGGRFDARELFEDDGHMKVRTQNAIFAAFHPSPVFEAIASFAEAFALGNDVFSVTEIDDRSLRRRHRREGGKDGGTVTGAWLSDHSTGNFKE